MRIVIEIDGGEISAATEQVRIATTSAAQIPAPPEVAAAAAAIGAVDAGVAPSGPPAGGAPLAPTPASGLRPVEGEAGDLAAGAAPGSAPDTASY